MNNVSLHDRQTHKDLILDILKELNSVSDNFVLKGGTCLMMFYESDRFSGDIDLDGYGNFDILNFITAYCNKHDYTVFIEKNTNIVKRVTIHYTNSSYLKIEISYRNYLNHEDKSDTKTKNGVQIYSLNRLFYTKLEAYKSRGKLRDIYDLNYMYLTYKHELTNDNISSLKRILYSEDKDVEYILSLLTASDDEYISTNRLLDKIVKMIDDLNIYIDDEVKTEIGEIEREMDISVSPVQFGK